MAKWQLQEAKNRLSELVRKATEEGSEVITLRGDDAVVVVAVDEFHKLARRSKGKPRGFPARLAPGGGRPRSGALPRSPV